MLVSFKLENPPFFSALLAIWLTTALAGWPCDPTCTPLSSTYAACPPIDIPCTTVVPLELVGVPNATIEVLQDGHHHKPEEYGREPRQRGVPLRMGCDRRIRRSRPLHRLDRVGLRPDRPSKLLEFPDDPACDQLDRQYLLGDALLVAPVFNAVGEVTTLGDVLAACASAAGREPARAEATDSWLTEHGVEPWMGPESLPLWVPGAEYAGFMTRSNQAALAAGLTLRPIAETVRAALEWEREAGLDRPRRAGLTPARERDLVQALQNGDRPV